MAARSSTVGEVLRTETVTPHMLRVVVGGPGLASFATEGFTDSYVKLVLPPPGAGWSLPVDLDAVREHHPRAEWPLTRTYTVRAWDADALELTLDFVHHGDVGVAGPWAVRLRPGDPVQLLGPGGAYRPEPGADWHLLVGDETVLPAIAVALEELPAGVPALVFVEVAAAEERQDLPSAADVRWHWVHRDDPAVVPGATLVEQVRAAELPDGSGQVFLHGEAGFVRDLRRHLRAERDIPREAMSVSGYWRRGSDDEGWRLAKKAWNAEVEAEEASLSAST